MLSLLIAGSLWTAAATAGDRPLPATAYEIHQAKVADGSAEDALWLGVAGFADSYSTAIALDRCNRCAEGNPLLPTSEARFAAKAVFTLASWFTLREMRHDGHHTRANRIRWVLVGLQGILVLNNSIHAARGR